MQAFFVNNLESADATVVVLGTGGTIAGTAASAQDVLGYTAGQVGVAALLNGVAGLHSLDCGVEAEQIAQVDSKDMDYAVWQHLAQRIEHHGGRADVRMHVIVISFGDLGDAGQRTLYGDTCDDQGPHFGDFDRW